MKVPTALPWLKRTTRHASLECARTTSLRLTIVFLVFAVNLAHGPPDNASVLHHGHTRYARLLQRKAWLRMSGDVAGSAGLCNRGPRPAGDSLPLRRAAHSQSEQIPG